MLAMILIMMGFLARIIFGGMNFAPVASIALFSGAYLDRRISPWVPLGIMALSDMLIGVHDVIFFTWGAFAAIGFMGILLKEKKTPSRIAFFTVAASLFFFAVSNFGVWLLWYPRNFQGFINCYVMALPFLRNSIFGNIVFSASLFGCYEILEPKWRHYVCRLRGAEG